MEIGSLLFILSILLVVVIFISQPISAKRSVPVSEAEKALSALLAEQERLLDALLELDFDFGVGKVPEEAYPIQRADLVKRGAAVMRELETFQATNPGQSADSQLEAQIEARGESKPTPSPDDDIEALIAARKEMHKGESTNFCHNCGKAVSEDDKFCVNCGADLT